MKHTPHKHAAVIKAWADGAPIQWRDAESSGWRDCGHHPVGPAWHPDVEYRVAPDPRLIYRVALWRPSVAAGMPAREPILILATRQENDREPREKWVGFVRWVSDWTEVPQ